MNLFGGLSKGERHPHPGTRPLGMEALAAEGDRFLVAGHLTATGWPTLVRIPTRQRPSPASVSTASSPTRSRPLRSAASLRCTRTAKPPLHRRAPQQRWHSLPAAYDERATLTEDPRAGHTPRIRRFSPTRVRRSQRLGQATSLRRLLDLNDVLGGPRHADALASVLGVDRPRHLGRSPWSTRRHFGRSRTQSVAVPRREKQRDCRAP